jgi:hypothetical protein
VRSLDAGPAIAFAVPVSNDPTRSETAPRARFVGTWLSHRTGKYQIPLRGLPHRFVVIFSIASHLLASATYRKPVGAAD